MPSRQEQLFYKLIEEEKEEDCWHKMVVREVINYDYKHYKCTRCPKEENSPFSKQLINQNPDFTTWNGFGWMIEKAEKVMWWPGFLIATGIKRTTEDNDFINTFTSPTALFNALCEYHGIREEV